ncbi:polycystin-1-like protein 1 [Leptodactylus fuscus]
MIWPPQNPESIKSVWDYMKRQKDLSKPAFIEDMRCTDSVCLPCGDGRGMLAIFTSAGPYISDVNIHFPSDQMQIRKPFVLEISGFLATSLERTTGIQNLKVENLTTVTIIVHWSEHNTSSSIARVGLNGHFETSFILMYPNPGNYSIRTHIRNTISEKECEINVEIPKKVPWSFGIKSIEKEPQISSYTSIDFGAGKSIMIAFCNVHNQFHAFVLHGTYLNFPWHCVNHTAENGVIQEGNANNCIAVTLTTIGQISIELLDINSTNLTIPIKFTLNAGSILFIEMLINDKISVHNLIFFPANAVRTHNSTMTADCVAPAVVSLEEPEESSQLYATDFLELNIASINILKKPILGEEVILVAKINGQVLWDKDYIYTWTFGNNVSYSTGSPVITFPCTQLGLHSVWLTVTNYENTMNSSIEYNVTKHESVAWFSHPSNGQLGQPILFTQKPPLKLLLPKDESITFLFGDNTSIHFNGSYFEKYGMNFTHQYKKPGLYNPTLMMEKMAIKLSSILLIQQPLQHLILYGPAVHSLNLRAPSFLTYIAKTNSGSNALYRWFFSDGKTNQTIIGKQKLNLDIESPCYLTVKVEAESPAGRLSASMKTLVQYSISDVTVTTHRAIVGHFTTFIISVEPYQQYVLQIHFGDGERIRVQSQEFTKGCLHKQHFCSVFVHLHKYDHVACYNVSVNVSNLVSTVKKIAEVTIEEAIHIELLTPPLIEVGGFINATLNLKSVPGVSYLWTIYSPFHNHSHLGSSISLITNVSGMHYITASESRSPQIQSPIKRIKVLDAIKHVTVFIESGIDHANLIENACGSYSTEPIQFKARTDAEANFIFDFGDGTPIVHVNGSMQAFGFGASVSHKYSKVGNYIINVVALNELFTATEEIGPFYVQDAPAGLSIMTNSKKVYKDDIILFSAILQRGTNVSYLWKISDQTIYNNSGSEISIPFSSVASYNVTVTVWNKVGMQKAWKIVNVLPRKKSIYIYTNGTVFSTDTFINFTARTEESGPLKFIWQFSDRLFERTFQRSCIKRLTVPNRYDVRVTASNHLISFTSDAHTIFVQRKVIPNRLVASSSVLLNSTVNFNCRINSGTNASYFWNFGDGIKRIGNNNDTHVYTREGEYTVNVSIFNNVSSAVLTKQIFVVKEHCQPPPVKHMGPLKIQIRRYEELHLGVTFEAAIHCNISQGLYYHWSFVKSDGTVIPFPHHIDNKKQTITLPAFFLDYGTYIAIARVQIVGNVVYSNYTVPVEVQPSDPVSVIANGHHFFIDKTTVKYFTLNGTPSFDPDNPEAQLRFDWSCVAVCSHEQLCFDPGVLNPLHKNDAVITFPTDQLNDKCDQFHFTLTVSNGDRKSLNTETFLSISPNTNFRFVEITCLECKGISINWNQQFSARAVCADCSDQEDISYHWSLYWINATEVITPDVPFCRLKESMGAPSALSKNVLYNATSTKVPTLQITSNTIYPTSVSTANHLTEHLPESTDLQKISNANSENSELVQDLYLMDLSESYLDLLEEGSTGNRNIMHGGSTMDRLINSNLNYKEMLTYGVNGFVSGDGEGGNPIFNDTEGQTIDDFETHFYSHVVEGAGGSGTETDRIESEIDFTYGFSDDYTSTDTGDNFVDSLHTTPNITTPMVHWLKLPINQEIFSSYTISGISSQTITIRPFLLKPSKMYMLNVTLESRGYRIGMSQLYFTVNEMSQKLTCQVQPKSGFEVFTIFSIFCTSGKEDLNYEFSYQVGKLPRKTLYNGRDIQYYFNLPSGLPSGGYQVTVFTRITNMYGSQTQPCPVNVTVLPIVFHNTSGNPLPQLELFQESLRNLSTLVLMGNHIEIRNYVVLLTTVLNRLYTEDSKIAFELQSEIRNKLIFIVQGLSFSNQDELHDIMSMLRDLFNATNQVTPESAMLIINYTRSIVKEKFNYTETRRNAVQKKLVENIILLISSAMEIYSPLPELKTIFEDGVECMSDLMLKFITLTNERHFKVSTNFLELQTSVHANVDNNIQRIGSSTFYLPKIQEGQNRRQNTSLKCYISQLNFFKKNPYFWVELPSKVNGEFTSLSLFDCFTRKKLRSQDIVTPVTMEVANKNQNESLNRTHYILFRDKINFHQFIMVPKNRQAALRITVSFCETKTRTFPILLLIRHSKKPSPSNFNIKQIHSSGELSTQLFIPAESIKDVEYIYLALMDADYKRHPKNKYISNMINYTLDVQWTQCLHWNNKQWSSEECSPQKGTTALAFTCRCARLGLYTTANKEVLSDFNMEDVSQFLSTTKNLVPSITVVICTVLYILLMVFGKIKDQHEDQKDGFVFLQDNSPNDQQQYAIMVDIGFRSRPKSTAKVHIILHGEDGVSETRELYCPDKPLFERNSRHTFIISVPESLGPLWKIHIWHNNSGNSPSLYLSHVIIKDLQSGTSWFFYAECWLAIDEGDGKVERELTTFGHGLAFRRLFYCKFTEYLEDFHFWGSVLSQPSYSWFSHTQRITTCFLLLLGYMCLNGLLIHWQEEQYTVEIGLIEISTISMTSGVKAILAVYPVVVLLSLLFRYSQKKITKDSGVHRFKIVKGSQINTTEGHEHSISAADTMFESNLTWQHFQYWAYDAWKKKYERDFSTSSVHIGNGSRRYKSQCPSVSSQSSRGCEECSSNNGDKTGVKKWKECQNGSQYMSDHSLFENSVLHGNKVLPSWCVYVAWSICATFSMICITIIVAFGFRFGPTKCVLWLHAVFFSLIYCIFIIQPTLIFLIALFVAWCKRDKTDFLLKALSEDVKYIIGEPYLSLENLTAFSRQSSHETSNFEKILAVRKRARYLRLARPPTPAQLKVAKDKLKRKNIVGKIFREFAVYIIMASMLIVIIIGKYSDNENDVNHAVKNEFIRNSKQPFGELKTENHWWNFCYNVLLDGVYWNKWHNEDALQNKARPMEGKFFIIGSPIMRKLDTANYSACAASFSKSDFPQLSKSAKDKPSTIEIQDQKFYQCGKIQCYEERGSIINLGRSRTEAISTLQNIQNQQWIDRRTRAVVVQYLLYNPPTNLFTTVSLLTELPVSGNIITSAHIDSVRIYRNTSPMDYFIMIFELMYLGTVIIYFYLQLNIMIQRGSRNYWQEPWNWVEAFIILLSLCYYSCQIYHYMLTVDMTDHLQRGFFTVFANFSFIAAIEKWTRCLHGITLFLIMIKFIKLLRFYKMMAPCVAVFQHSCSSSAFTVLIGVVFTMAYSSFGHLMFSTESSSFCTALNSIETIFIHLLGVRGTKHINFSQNQMKSNHISLPYYYGALFLTFTILWTGMRKGILTSVSKYSKKAQRKKHLVTVKELTSHASRLVLSMVGRQRQKNTDNICVTGSNYYLDEFEDLIDELLFRLNAISDSLHHSLPAKSQCYTEEDGDMNQFDTTSDFSLKQTMTKAEYILEEKLKVDSVQGVTMQSELHRDCSDVSGINLHCFTQQHVLENAYRNGSSISEDVLSKPNYCEEPLNHTLDTKQSILKTEDEHGLSTGNVKHCLAVFQHGYASEFLPSDGKSVLPPVLYMHPCENAVDLEYNRTRCTSANIQNKNRRLLRRSHTTVIESLQSNTPALRKKSIGHGSKITYQNNEQNPQQPQCEIFQQRFCDIINVKQSTQTYVETKSHTSQQKNIKNTIQRDDKTPFNTSANVIPCSVKQCW